MKSILQKNITRLGAFIGVMAVCYCIVVAGAWHSSVVTPTLSVNLPSFSADIKATAARLHAKKSDICPLPAAGTLRAGACETEKHMCGRRDGDSCGATSLYCGCHAHDANHAGTAAAGAPDSLPTSGTIFYASLVRSPVPDAPASHKFLFDFKVERPPSSPLV